MSATRRCQGCHEPTMVRIEAKKIRLGIVEERFACRTCGRAITTFNRVGYVVWFGMLAVLVGLTAAGFAAGKVKPGDGPGIAVVMAVLVGAGAILGGRALAADRRNPPVAGAAPGGAGGGGDDGNGGDGGAGGDAPPPA